MRVFSLAASNSSDSRMPKERRPRRENVNFIRRNVVYLLITHYDFIQSSISLKTTYLRHSKLDCHKPMTVTNIVEYGKRKCVVAFNRPSPPDESATFDTERMYFFTWKSLKRELKSIGIRRTQISAVTREDSTPE